jgi:hypothetical protein
MVAAEFFESTGGILLIALAFGGWVIVAVVSTIATNVRKARDNAHLAGLKHSMIEKGMSPEEIERVLRASPRGAEEEDSPAIKLTKKLAEHEVAANVIQEILAIFRAVDPSTQRTLAKSVGTMLDHGADTERVLAAVRALCGCAAAPAPESGPKDYRFTDEASSFRS